MVTREGEVWPGWPVWPGPGMRTMTEMSRAASVDQAARTAQPVLANVWCRPCHEPGHVTRDGGSLGSVTPGCGRLGQHPERWHRERSGDPGYDTQYATLRAPGDIGQCHQRDIVTEWCNTTLQTAASTPESFARHLVFYKVFRQRTTQQQNFTPPWSFYFGPVLIFQSRRVEVYLIVSIRISQPVKSFIGAVSWARREKKVVLNPRHVQRSFELGQQWSIELLRYISFRISSWPFQNWIWKWNGWILFYAPFRLIDQH